MEIMWVRKFLDEYICIIVKFVLFWFRLDVMNFRNFFVYLIFKGL